MARYFNEDEIKGLDQRLVDILDNIRGRVGQPLVITSGLRTPDNNAKLAGSADDSAHLKGLAADIRCDNSALRYKIIEAAFFFGLRRIEAATRHVHIDIDEDKPQNVLWLGISS